MPIKPSPTIAGKLRKLFSNNKQTIEPAIGDSIPGGSGGGANVLTLYAGEKDGDPWAYKNYDCTEEYATYEEAKSAVENAQLIIVVGTSHLSGTDGVIYTSTNKHWIETGNIKIVGVQVFVGFYQEQFVDLNLYGVGPA